ncbi:MAG TPA: TolC family protein [bacterium]|nr:TolC family protein [bacterium]
MPVLSRKPRVHPFGLAALLALVAAPLAAQQRPPGHKQAPEKPIPLDQEAEARGTEIKYLRLADALRRGRQANVALKAAELLPQQARLDLLFAEAAFQPELYGNTGFRESRSPQRNAFSPSVTSQTIDATLGWRHRVITGGLFDLAFQPTRFDSDGGGGAFPSTQFQSQWVASFRQPLLRGAWSDYALAQVTAAKYRFTQAEHQLERTAQDTLLAIVEAYWELAFARENWRVVDSALSVALEQLRITEERIRVEDLPPRDRIADEAEVARRREELIVAENAIRDREDDLRRLLFDGSEARMWRYNLRPIEPIDVDPAADLPPFERLVETALQRRPDIQALRSAVAAAEVAELEADRDLLPQLDFVGSYSSSGVSSDDPSTGRQAGFRDSFRDASDQQFPDWSVRIEFSIPIGNQAARARSRRAKLEVERQRRLLHQAMIDATREVREALRRLRTLGQSITAARESVRLATSNLETEQVKLRVGASTAFEVQRRNQELREARSRLLRNQLDYRTAESRLLHVQGLLRAGTE